MRFGIGVLAFVFVLAMALPASAAFTLTNGTFDDQGPPVWVEEPGYNIRPLAAAFSPTGWYQSDLTGGGVADPLQDTVVGPMDLGGNGWPYDPVNDPESVPQDLWDGIAITLWQFWNGPSSREDGYWYTSLGTYTDEAAITLDGSGFRIPSGDAAGNFTVEFYYVPQETPFSPADESDVAEATGAVLVGSELIDINYLQPGESTPFSSTQYFDGSGIDAGDQVWLRFGDGPDIPPYFDNHDFPVIDDLSISNRVRGDVDGDGNVNGTDLDYIQANFGMVDADFGDSTADYDDGDLFDDGIIDLKDYVVWKSNNGYTSPGSGAGGSGAIPEPASVLLLTLGGLMLAGLRSRR